MIRYFFYFFLFVLYLSGTNVWGQDSTCTSDPKYQLMDFWLGRWQVFDFNEKLVGANYIEKILENCAVMEQWESSQGNQGKSLLYVDNNSGTWKQIWVTENAKQPWGQKEKTLIYSRQDSILVFQGSYKMQDINILDRTILTKVSPVEVQQTIQVSQDGGINWKTAFEATYKK